MFSGVTFKIKNCLKVGSFDGRCFNHSGLSGESMTSPRVFSWEGRLPGNVSPSHGRHKGSSFTKTISKLWLGIADLYLP